MSIEKLDFSLRLRHEDADLVPIARRFNLEPSIAWKKDDQRALPDGTGLAGTRDSSYCSIDLSVHDATDLDAGLVKCLDVLDKHSQELRSFVMAGGMVSLAVGWFCNGDAGVRIHEATIGRLAELMLTLDFYLYFSNTTTDTESD